MPATQRKRDAQISVRLTLEQKDFIARAAMLETGGDISRFTSEATLRAAKHAIQEHGISQVTEEIRQRFYDILLNPPNPSSDLVALALSPVPSGFELAK